MRRLMNERARDDCARELRIGFRRKMFEIQATRSGFVMILSPSERQRAIHDPSDVALHSMKAPAIKVLNQL